MCLAVRQSGYLTLPSRRLTSGRRLDGAGASLLHSPEGPQLCALCPGLAAPGSQLDCHLP
jgi:hypothetical protein